MIYYITLSVTAGIIIGWTLRDFLNYDPKNDPNPSISEIEKSYKNHKHYGFIPAGKPVMYNKLKYIILYHNKMISFYDEMMTEENDGLNPFDLEL